MDIHFVANAKSTFAKRKPFYKRYCRQPFTLTERGMGYRKFFRKEIAKKSIDFTPVFEFGRAGIIKKIIEESEDCIPHLLSFAVQEKIKEGKLVYLDVCDMKTYICK